MWLFSRKKQAKKFLFRFYVSGETDYTEMVHKNLYLILQELIADQYKIEIVNVLFEPKTAKQDQITLTPSLAMIRQNSIIRYTGRFHNFEGLRYALSKLIQMESEMEAQAPEALQGLDAYNIKMLHKDKKMKVHLKIPGLDKKKRKFRS